MTQSDNVPKFRKSNQNLKRIDKTDLTFKDVISADDNHNTNFYQLYYASTNISMTLWAEQLRNQRHSHKDST